MAQDPGRCRGRGGASAPRALARPRGDRKPGHRGLSLGAATPVREEVLPGALRRCLPRYIVEQETGQRGSRAVEEGAPDAEPPRGCQDKWRRGQRSDTPRCQGRAGLGGGADLGRGRGPQVAGPHPGASRASPFALRWSLSCAGSEGGPRGTDLPLPREEVGGEGLPSVPGQEGRRPRPPASTQALAPLWLLSVSRAVDAVHLLVMGPSSRSRDPPSSPIPSVLLAPPGSGKEPRVGSPPHPASDPAFRGASLRWERRSKFCQARPSCVRKEPGEDVDGTGAGSACNPHSSGCKWPCSDWERPGKTASPGRTAPKQRARGTQRLADNECRA